MHYANITYPIILSLLVFSLLSKVYLKVVFIQITYLVENNFFELPILNKYDPF